VNNGNKTTKDGFMRYPELHQILEDADRTIDQLSDKVNSTDYVSVTETMHISVSKIEKLRQIAITVRPPDHVDKPKSLEIIELAFAVMADVKTAIDTKDQNESNANLYLLSLALDDIVEIVINEGRTID
jgi:hypothetical protein